MQEKDPDHSASGTGQNQDRAVQKAANDSSGKLLSGKEVIEASAEYQQYALSLVPLAIKVIAGLTRSEDDRTKLAAAVELCRIAGLTRGGNVGQATAAADQKRDEEKYTSAGMLFYTIVEKSERFKMPLPLKVIEDVRELHRRVEECYKQYGTEEDELAREDKDWNEKHPLTKKTR